MKIDLTLEITPDILKEAKENQKPELEGHLGTHFDVMDQTFRRYYKEHPQLSMELIHALLEKKVSIIGIDFAGVRRGAEHIPTDQLCAEQGVFVIENLRHLETLFGVQEPLLFHTYPMHMTGVTGLPCRVIAEK